jgi:hypothetical protein
MSSSNKQNPSGNGGINDKSAWDLFLEIYQEEKKATAEYQALALSMGVEYLDGDTARPHLGSVAHLDAEQLQLLANKHDQILDMSQRALIALRVDQAKADQVDGIN